MLTIRRFVWRFIAHRMFFPLFARSASNLMEPGETFITFRGEEPVNGDHWVVTDRAIYMQTTGTRYNRRHLGQMRTTRFPFESVEGVTRHARGSTTELRLWLDDSRSISGIFGHQPAEVLGGKIQRQIEISRRTETDRD